MSSTWKVRAYIEYEIEASCEEESIYRLTECLMHDLEETEDIREVAEVNAEKISDKGLEDDEQS
jgi:hypothetical protein